MTHPARAPLSIPNLTIVIPTRNEAANVKPLLDALNRHVGHLTAVLFVDDSDDGLTPQVIETESSNGHYQLDIKLLHRVGAQRDSRLGGAVMDGLRLAMTPYVCVMDGDLQHPPQVVAKLLVTALETDADLVVASRYTRGGSNEGLSFMRVVISRGSTLLARLFFGRRLLGITDPMSGFFLVKRSAVGAQMNPTGFKILLELAARHPEWRRVEVPFTFAQRHEGESKGDISEGLRYLRMLPSLWLSLHPINRVSWLKRPAR